ncbi:MAG: carboxypeptidase regulatory-like domain-containing protein [Acidobacteria bacterium]|nr:carboxypeptidase regulatory-like domain-containing protein [Acidobacteriota bacterium]
MSRKLCFLVIGVVFAFTVKASPSLAQTQFGSIRGVITDASGASIPGVNVRATNNGTGVETRTESNEVGDYLLGGLLPGKYTVTAQKLGFRESKSTEVDVVFGGIKRVDVKLEVGEITESVTVEAEQGRMDTETGTVIIKPPKELLLRPATLQRAEWLPSENVAAYMAGHSYGGGTAISAYGSQSYDRRVTLDGAQVGIGTLRLPRGSVEELQSAALNADAEHQTSQTSKMISSRGTNDLHGAIWAELRHQGLYALPFYATGAPRPPSRPEAWGRGFRVGGPVYFPKLYNGHNKTFFFTSYQRYPTQSQLTIAGTVPSERMRQGDLNELGVTIRDPITGQPFSSNTIPAARISPIAKKVLDKFYPSIGSAPYALNNLKSPATIGSTFYDVFLRVDQQFGSKNTLSGTYAYNNNNAFQPQSASYLGPPTTGNRTVTSTLNFLNLSDNHVIGPNTLNEFNIGVRAGPANTTLADTNGQAIMQELGLPLAPGAPDIGGGPTFAITGISPAQFPVPNVSDARVWTIRDTFSWVKGRFTSKFTFETIRPTSDSESFGSAGNNISATRSVFGLYQFTGLFSSSGYADLLLGLPSATARELPLGKTGLRERQTGFAWQEDIRLTSRLNVNFGLRVQTNGVPVEPSNLMYNFDVRTGNLVVVDDAAKGRINPGLSQDIKNRIVTAQTAGFPGELADSQTGVLPRFGFAYRLSNDTVIRGGYGVYSSLAGFGGFTGGPFTSGVENYTNSNNCAGQGTNCTPLFTLNNPFPSGTGGGVRPVSGLGVSGINPDLGMPKTRQWNLTVERRLGNDMSVRVSYVGLKSTHLPYRRNINLPPASGIPFTQARLVYPQWFGVTYADSGGSSVYHSGDIELSKNFSNGLSFVTSYTYAKNLSDVDEDGTQLTWGSLGRLGPVIENPYDRKREWGNAHSGYRHFYKATALYDLPFGRGKRFLSDPNTLGGAVLDKIVGDWSFSNYFYSRSGWWYSPFWDGFDAANTGQTRIRADRVSDGNVDNRGEFRLYDTNAFTRPQPGRYGNSGRGIIQGLGAWKWDLGLYKTFRFSANERVPRFRVGLSSMNVLNHPAKQTWAIGPYLVNNPVTAAKANDTIYDSVVTGGLGAWRRFWVDLQVEF